MESDRIKQSFFAQQDSASQESAFSNRLYNFLFYTLVCSLMILTGILIMAMQTNPANLRVDNTEKSLEEESTQRTRSALLKSESPAKFAAEKPRRLQTSSKSEAPAAESFSQQSNLQQEEALQKREAAEAYLALKNLDVSNEDSSFASYPSIRPVKGGYISGYFGRRRDPFTGSRRHHNGVDIAVDAGSDVLVAADGVVLQAKKRYTLNYGYGREILVDHGGGIKTRYAHLSKVLVQKGQKVKKGEIIGLSGQTGRTTGPHLHYEVIVNNRAKSPTKFFQEPRTTLANMGR